MTTNRHLKRASVIFCATVLVLTLSSCKRKTPPEESSEEIPAQEKPEQATESLIVELGVGPIKFGMSGEEVIKNLGKPDKIEGKGAGLNYVASKGISLFVSPQRGVQTIDCWSKEYPFPLATISNFPGKTKEGIGMGASREQIVAIYGQPDNVTTQGPLTTLYYSKLRTYFTITRDRLVNIKMEGSR